MPPREDAAVRFARYLSPPDANGCILWRGGRGKRNGKKRYGVFSLSMADGVQKKIGAHVFAWEQVHGPVPEGMTVNHLCFVHHCVNTAHMDLRSRADNCRHYAESISHCPAGHAYEGANLVWKKNQRGTLQRICRECRNAKKREARAARA